MSKFNQHNTKSAKLTASQVLEIRVAYADGTTQGSLARKYNISIGQIGRIVRGESWNSFQQVETDQAIERRMVSDSATAVPATADEIQASQERLLKMLGREQTPALNKLLTEINEGPETARRLMDELK